MPTFESPIFIKSRQRTTNDGPISADTTGATLVARTILESDNNGVSLAIPAGSFVTRIRTFVTTAAVDAAMTVTVTGTNIGTTPTAISITSGALGANNRVLDVIATAGTTLSQAEAVALTNVGSSDVTFTFQTTSSAGAQQSYHVIEYLARNMDGSTTPQGQGLTN